MNFLADKVNSIKALAGGGRRASFKLSTLVEKHALLVRVAVVSERNREAVVEALRAVTELLIWGDKHDAAFFEFFLEKNMVAIFWRLLAQPATPASVKVQLLQTLAMLVGNIDAGPSVYYMLSNNHINELIRHPFDFGHDEIQAQYVTLLKAIALRLDAQTVQFFVDESAADGKKFPLFEEALKLWRHPERMVRTAVRTIVLSVCRVDDDAARRVVGGCTLLPTQLLASVRAEHGRLVAALARKPPPPNKPAAAASAALVSAAEDALQQLLDELYFVNDLLETNVPALAPALSAALLSQFALALLAAPLTDQLPPTLRAAASAADADADGAPVSPTTANSRSSGAAWRGVRPPIELISPPPPLKNDESMPRVVEFSAAAAGDAEVLDAAAGISILTSRLGGLSEPDPLHDEVSEVRRDAGAEPPTSELGNELGSSFESYSVLGGPEELSEDHCVPSREPSGVAASAPPSSVGGRSESKLWPDCDDRCPIPRPNGDPPRPHALSSPPVRDGGVCSASCRLLAPRSSAPPEPDLARVDVADLMEGNRVMHLTLNDQVYTLRITRAQKLILTK